MRDRKQTILIATLLLIWAIVTPYVWRDLERQPAERIRGSKWMWRVASANLLGSAAYVVFGRRHRDQVLASQA
jgi:hypothetical protein